MKDIILALEKYRIDLPELIIQIKKDLILAGIDTDILQSVQNEKELVYRFFQLIEELLIHSPNSFQNLLYRIDLDEKKLDSLNSEHIQWELTVLILQRELQKVYFRKKFSQ